MHYQFKQDLAMAYFDGCSKKTASRLLAREISLTPGLLFVHRFAIETFTGCFFSLRTTGNPEGELSTAEINQMKRRTVPHRNAPLPSSSKSSSPSSANPDPRRGDEHLEKYRHYGE